MFVVLLKKEFLLNLLLNNTQKFEKQLRQDDAFDNVVSEIKLLQGRCNDFHFLG